MLTKQQFNHLVNSYNETLYERIKETGLFLDIFEDRNVPSWIKENSSLCRENGIQSLDVFQNINFDIKYDDKVNNLEDFLLVLEHIKFFDISPYPLSLYVFLFQNKALVRQTLEGISNSRENKLFYDYFIEMIDQGEYQVMGANPLFASTATILVLSKIFPREDIEHQIIISGNLDVLKEIPHLEHCDKCIYYAVLCNHIHIVKWLMNKYKNTLSFNNTKLCEIASQNGNLEMLKILREKYAWNDRTSYFAIEKGYIDILKYTREGSNPCPLPPDYFEFAIKNKQWDILKYLLQFGYNYPETYLISHVASTGNIEMVKWLRNEGWPWNENVYFEAVSSGNIKLVIWIQQNSDLVMPCSTVIMTKAAIEGHIDMIKWLHSFDSPWNETTSSNAKNLETLKYLVENGCPYNEEFIYSSTRVSEDMKEWIRNYNA